MNETAGSLPRMGANQPRVLCCLAAGGESSLDADGVLHLVRCEGAEVGEAEVGGAVSAEPGAKDGEEGRVAGDGYEASIGGKCGAGGVLVDGEDHVADGAGPLVFELKLAVVAGRIETIGERSEVGGDVGGSGRAGGADWTLRAGGTGWPGDALRTLCAGGAISSGWACGAGCAFSSGGAGYALRSLSAGCARCTGCALSSGRAGYALWALGAGCAFGSGWALRAGGAGWTVGPCWFQEVAVSSEWQMVLALTMRVAPVILLTQAWMVWAEAWTVKRPIVAASVNARVDRCLVADRVRVDFIFSPKCSWLNGSRAMARFI